MDKRVVSDAIVEGSAAVEVPGLALELLRPGRRARLAARLRARALDRRLAAGADPSLTPSMAARAAALTGRGTRERVADDVERLVAHAHAGPTCFQITPARAAIQAATPQLRELVDSLRGDAPVYARGVAETIVLLVDGTGPAYRDRGDGGLIARVQRACADLRG